MSQPLESADHPISPDGPRRPAVLVFDVNETLSDMTPMAERFVEVGAPGHLAKTWFAGVLRDGFALTAVGVAEPFAKIAATALREALAGQSLTTGLDDAVAHVMDGFAQLTVHEDVPDGLRALAGLGIRLVTLSNGSSSVARRLLTDAGLVDLFEDLLSVEEAGIWKPAPGAYAHAVERCRVDPMDAMLVAVHPWDTDGAHRAGLASVWINRAAATYPDYFVSPALEVSSLTELADRLR